MSESYGDQGRGRSHSPRSGWIEINPYFPQASISGKSHSPRSGWIEINPYFPQASISGKSHSPRSGWIEIVRCQCRFCKPASHSPRSGWIEIVSASNKSVSLCPTPHGVGGLKFTRKGILAEFTASHSPRSGWIEMGFVGEREQHDLVPLPTEWVD